MENLKPNLSVVVDVKAINYQNGNVIEGKGTITKTTSDRADIANEDSLTFRGSDCGKSTMEANYNSSTIGIGEQTTNVELGVKGRVLTDKKELVDVVEASSKLKTVFAGRDKNHKTEEWLKVKLENSCDAKCATTDSFYTTKTTEIVK